MQKCDCYDVAEEIIDWFADGSPKTDLVSRCFGTKERDICYCGGDRSKCDFYPEVREKAQKEVEISLLADGNAVAISKSDCNPYAIIIKTNDLKIYHTDLEMTVAVSDDILSKIETIEVNGYKFIKENKK
jgi:hypothetical protein